MEDWLKNRILLGLGIFSAILLILTISLGGSSGRNKKMAQSEMAVRMELEEKMSNFSKEKAKLEDALEEEKAANQATKKALVAEQALNQDLKEELDKVTKLKEALEEDLKDALAGKKKSSK